MEMEVAEIKKMRMNQLFITNGLLVTTFILYFTIMNVFEITFAQFFLVLAIILLVQSCHGLIKGDSTKSFLPFFEKIAVYEKKKMGNEWYKQRKAGNILNLLLSGLMFLQSYSYQNITGYFSEIDTMFWVIIVLFILVILNIGMMLHFRKVDRSGSELDLKGYTWKANLVGAVIGLVFGLALFAFIIFYVITL